MKNIKKMKKVSIKLIAIPLLMSLCSFKVNNDYDKELVNNIFTSLTYMDEGFKGSSISTPIKLIDNNDQSCLLFKTYLNNKYTGYFILDNNYELLISHVDSLDYYQDVKDNYYLTDIFTISKDRDEISSKSNVNNTNNIKSLKNIESQRVLKSITDEELPDVDSSTYHSSSSSFGSTIYIDGVPEYYNSPSQFLVYKTGGCSPTAGAMLTSFYDMNCSYFNNLYVPNLPMKHEEDISRVRNAINSIGTFMRTEYDSGGTIKDNIKNGITDFLRFNNLSLYKMNRIEVLTDKYTNINQINSLCSSIIQKNNIALLSIDIDYKNGNEVKSNHTVVLTGYNNYQYVGVTLKVNYGWQSQSVYNITNKCVSDFYYLVRA